MGHKLQQVACLFLVLSFYATVSGNTVNDVRVQRGAVATGAKEVAKLVSGAVKVTDSYFEKKGGWKGARKEFWSLGPGKTRSTTLQSAQGTKRGKIIGDRLFEFDHITPKITVYQVRYRWGNETPELRNPIVFRYRDRREKGTAYLDKPTATF